MNNIDTWLRKEAGELAIKADKIEKKIIQEINKRNYDKINELNIQKRELNAQEIKLYEMIGRLNEIERLVGFNCGA